MCYTYIGDNMKKVININLKSESDLVDKYNDTHVSRDLIDYILEQTKYINKKDEIEFVINKDFETDATGLIKTGIRNEYLIATKQSRFDNIKQITFLILGLICLILYTLFGDIEVFGEIILIGGWILMGESIEIQLFSDPVIKRNKMILKKMLNSNFIENGDKSL